MKKLLMVSTLVAGLLLAGGCGKTADTASSGATAVASTGDATVVFEMADAMGDDNGPGTYTYPTDRVFAPGAFDLTNFKITDDGANYNFVFTIASPFKNDWKQVGGWDVQLFDVYMNLGEGKNTQTLSGRHVIIEDGWDVAIMAGSDKPNRMRKEVDDKNDAVADDNTDPEDIAADVKTPEVFKIEGDTLTATIAKDAIGDLSKLQGLQVFLLGGEGFPSKNDTYNRVVNEYSAQWRFGGGSDYFGNPNVIDILGDNSALGSYESDEGVSVFAKVKTVK